MEWHYVYLMCKCLLLKSHREYTKCHQHGHLYTNVKIAPGPVKLLTAARISVFCFFCFCM